MKPNNLNLRPKQLSFESEKLQIDFITLNITIEGQIDPEPIGEFLFWHGFNSKVKENEKDTSKILLWNKKNKHRVTLVKSKYNPKKSIFWNGLMLRFSSSNGRFLYDLLKQKKIKFELFPERNIRLGRFDLVYCFDFPEFYSRFSIKIFLENSRKKYLEKYSSYFARVNDTEGGLILRAGPGSNAEKARKKKFFRIYEKFRVLRFEFEMKRTSLEPNQNSFFSYNFEEFEDELTTKYCKEFSNVCIFDCKYSDWLLDRLRRRISVKKMVDVGLGKYKAIISPYNLRFTRDKETSAFFLLLFSFIQSEKVTKDLQFVKLLDLVIVDFAVVDFIRFMDKDVKCTRMRRKVLDFFNDLFELEPLQIQVDDVRYQKFYFCSWLQVGKRKNKWFIKLRISTPYTFPVTFLTYKTKSELEIKLQIFASINSRSYFKEFEIDKTYRDLSLSGDAIKNRETMIFQAFKDLKTDKMINNSISVSLKDISKKEICLKIDNLKPDMLRKINKISFPQRFD